MAIGQGGSAGVKSYVAMFVETSFGVYPATAATGASTLEPISVGFKTEISGQKLDTLSFNRGFTHHVQLDKIVGGTLEQFLHPEESVRLFCNALGGAITSASDATTANGYIHSLTAGDYDSSSTITSLSFLVRKGDTHHFKYSGGRVNSMKITANIGEPVRVAYDFLFSEGTQAGSSIATNLSTSSILPFTYVQGNMYFADSEASLTTTAVEHITGFELTINNNLADNVRSLGTNTVVTLPPTRREIEFKITQRFDTTTAYTRFMEHSNSAVQLEFVGSSISATDNYECSIVMPKVYLDTPDMEVGSSTDIITSEINYQVLVDDPNTTTGKDIGVTFQNNTASY